MQALQKEAKANSTWNMNLATHTHTRKKNKKKHYHHPAIKVTGHGSYLLSIEILKKTD